MLKDIYVTVTIVKEIKIREIKLRDFLFIIYFIVRLKIGNYKRKKYG